MNDYEILLMLDPDLPEERQEEIVKRTRDLVEKGGGTWDGQDAWGRRKLAYEIDKKGDGVYHLLSFSADGDTLDEIFVTSMARVKHPAVHDRFTREVKPQFLAGSLFRITGLGIRGIPEPRFAG